MTRWRIIMVIFCLLMAACGAQRASDSSQIENGDLSIYNLPSGSKAAGEAVSSYLRARTSCTVAGWSDNGSEMLVLSGGKLARANLSEGITDRVLGFEGLRIHQVEKVIANDASGFVFLADSNGDEYKGVYLVGEDAATSIKISTGRSHSRGLVVSSERKRIAFAAAEAGQGTWTTYVYATCCEAVPQILHTGKLAVLPKDFHPEQPLLLTTAYDGEAFTLSEWNLDTGAETVLTLESREINQAVYSADGKFAFFTTDARSEFVELHRLDRWSGERVSLFGEVGADIEAFSFSHDQSRLAVQFNREGESSITVFDAPDWNDLMKGDEQTGPLDRHASLGVVSEMYFSPDGKRLAIRVSSPDIPARSGVYDPQTGKFEQWCGGLEPDEKIERLVPVHTTFPTFDLDGENARQIPMFVYRPAQARTPRPVVIIPHGGPASQSRPSFDRLVHYYVTRMDVVVIRPNIRGSTGYGKTFEQLDELDRRPDAVKDVGALLDWIEEQPDMDASRVAISGGSYGGFVSLASLIAYPERLRGAISRVGLTDFETFLQHTELYRVADRRREYGDEREPAVRALFAEMSPIKNASKIVRPVLLIQGAQDPRVPVQQADDMVIVLQNNDVPVSYLRAQNEGHSFRGIEVNRLSQGAQVEFLKSLFDLD